MKAFFVLYKKELREHRDLYVCLTLLTTLLILIGGLGFEWVKDDWSSEAYSSSSLLRISCI